VQFRHYFRTHAAPRRSFLPTQLAQRYNFPPGDGAGQTVGVIELGGGYRVADLTAYLAALNLPPADVTAVGVLGGANAPTGDPNGPDGEVMLDLCVLAAVAPKARFRVYFAPNSDGGFLEACRQACRECDVVSISWGGPEDQWDPSSLRAFDAVFASAALLGVTVTAASGDSGSGDGEASGDHVDFPASSPHVLACGGTRINGDNTETVWGPPAAGNGATGGGFSATFSLPAWQFAAAGRQGPGRGIPDVAADADPATGYTVRVDGTSAIIGGTSAVAPLWAGLAALINQNLGKRVCLAAGTLYGLTAGTLRDVTSGSNGSFTAAAGWDPCTGLGVPDGGKLLARLLGQPPTPPVVPPPVVPPPPANPATLTLAEALVVVQGFFTASEKANPGTVRAVEKKLEPQLEDWFRKAYAKKAG
jgi:kumamolisin